MITLVVNICEVVISPFRVSGQKGKFDAILKRDDKSIAYGDYSMADSKNAIIERIDKLEKIAKSNLLDTNRLKKELQKLDNSKKFIIGSAVLTHIEKSDQFSNMLLEILQKEVRSDNDIVKIGDVLTHLKSKVENKNSKQ